MEFNSKLTTAIAVSMLFIAGCTTKQKSSAQDVASAKSKLTESGDQDDDSKSSLAGEVAGTSVARKGDDNQSMFLNWPVNEARMTRGFLPHKKKKPHLGLDLAAPKGSPILAAQDGTVIYVGREFRGYGKMIMIEGRTGFATLYAHLSKIGVREGEKVRQGQQIGEMGRTGHATGSHLHFEVRTDAGPIDPLLYLPDGSNLARTSERSEY